MLKKLFDSIFILFILSLIFLGTYATEQKKENPYWQPNLMGYKLVEVSYEGVYDKVRVGDLIVVKEQEKYQQNDIIMYHVGQFKDMGRIATVSNDSVVPRKETSYMKEFSVRNDMVIGKMEFCIPNGALLFKILIHPLTTGVLATILFSYVLYQINRKYRS